MLMSDGYSIEQYPKQNRIVITMPQTMRTVTNTVGVIGERKDKLTDTELIAILSVAKMCFENGGGHNESIS